MTQRCFMRRSALTWEFMSNSDDTWSGRRPPSGYYWFGREDRNVGKNPYLCAARCCGRRCSWCGGACASPVMQLAVSDKKMGGVCDDVAAFLVKFISSSGEMLKTTTTTKEQCCCWQRSASGLLRAHCSSSSHVETRRPARLQLLQSCTSGFCCSLFGLQKHMCSIHRGVFRLCYSVSFQNAAWNWYAHFYMKMFTKKKKTKKQTLKSFSACVHLCPSTKINIFTFFCVTHILNFCYFCPSCWSLSKLCVFLSLTTSSSVSAWMRHCVCQARHVWIVFILIPEICGGFVTHKHWQANLFFFAQSGLCTLYKVHINVADQSSEGVLFPSCFT